MESSSQEMENKTGDFNLISYSPASSPEVGYSIKFSPSVEYSVVIGKEIGFTIIV